MGENKELDFGGKAWDPARAIRVPKEAAAAWGIAEWGREKRANAKGGAEGALPFFSFFLIFPKHFHRYCLGPNFIGGGGRIIKHSSFQKILASALGKLETINEYIYKLYTRIPLIYLPSFHF